jgi:hypothetical protein
VLAVELCEKSMLSNARTLVFGTVGWLLALACAAIGWITYLAAAPAPPPLSKYVPAGPLVYLEAKDFSTVLGDWNSSPEKKQWLTSDNYEVFSRSRLFLRLKGAATRNAARQLLEAGDTRRTVRIRRRDTWLSDQIQHGMANFIAQTTTVGHAPKGQLRAMFLHRNGLGIDVHCALDSRVPQKFLLHFDIGGNAAQHG